MSTTTAKQDVVTIQVNGFTVAADEVTLRALLGIEVQGAVLVQQPKADVKAKTASRRRRSAKPKTATETVSVRHLGNGDVYDVDAAKWVYVSKTRQVRLGSLAKSKAFQIRVNGATYKVA